MDNANLNRWLTLFANVSVVVGIVILAIQVSQNTDTLEQNALYMRLALMDVGYQQTADWRNMLVADEEVGDLWEKGCRSELTEQETTDYEYLVSTWLVQQRNLHDRVEVLGGGAAAALMAESTATQLRNCELLRQSFHNADIHHIISPNWKAAVENALARMDNQQ